MPNLPVNPVLTHTAHFQPMTQEPGPVLTQKIIGIAINVHRKLGPGLLESVYKQCLCWVLQQHGYRVERKVALSLEFESLHLDRAYQADIIVEQNVLRELKSVEPILPIHEAQTRSYLRLSGCQVGLLMNFNSVMLKDGLRRFIP